MPEREKSRIFPIFLPHAGCPGRCLFCNQTAQSGTDAATSHIALEQTLSVIATELEERRRRAAPPVEVGFYGGTFTALPYPWPERFLHLVAGFQADGIVSKIRCSTRPDAITPARLAELAPCGLDTIELGVQTFDDTVLQTSGRHLNADTIRTACQLVKDAGLRLGIQLLPGLPGHTPEHFFADIDESIRLAPDLIRIYPCLVLRHTGLHTLYKKGLFVPWKEEDTVEALRQVLPRLWAARIHIARIGLAATEELSAAFIAGPHHPAIAAKSAGLALFDTIRPRLHRIPGPKTLFYPARLQGMLYGHRGQCRSLYALHHLTTKTMRPWSHPHFALIAGAEMSLQGADSPHSNQRIA
ncbi:elongator complex protein 3 [Desulfovibrio inopinatus]|uniref:elongator complex protein 3 n=1 Tax=Desulfovibrio inopinatus TaxID=102109 RepID=UPI0004025F5E|nr:radical SAM protein [Desulfovibrio inopinatus]